MKYLLALIIPFLFSTQTVNAQAWDKSTKVISLGIGASSLYHVGTANNRVIGLGRSYYAPITGQLNVEGEFGVHDYVGVGFHTGIGGGVGVITGYSGSFNVPIGVLANFHFYKLIADKTGKDLKQDVLDVFVGVNVGSGVGVIFYNSSFVNDQVVPLAYGGLHVGARWYFSENIGLSGQFGFGQSLIDVGLVFKL